MGKRHHASRRRAYGRRQHEVRERTDRPTPDGLTALGVRVYDIGPTDGLVLEQFAARPTAPPRIAIVPATAD